MSGKGLFITANEETLRKLHAGKSLETNYGGPICRNLCLHSSHPMCVLRFINVLSDMVEFCF